MTLLRLITFLFLSSSLWAIEIPSNVKKRKVSKITASGFYYHEGGSKHFVPTSSVIDYDRSSRMLTFKSRKHLAITSMIQRRMAVVAKVKKDGWFRTDFYKKLNDEQFRALVKSARKFMAEVGELNIYKENEPETVYHRSRSLFLFNEAFAQGSQPNHCFFGGWVSVERDYGGYTFCSAPWLSKNKKKVEDNYEHQRIYDGKCPGSQRTCNPLLFGDACYSVEPGYKNFTKTCREQSSSDSKITDIAESIANSDAKLKEFNNTLDLARDYCDSRLQESGEDDPCAPLQKQVCTLAENVEAEINLDQTSILSDDEVLPVSAFGAEALTFCEGVSQLSGNGKKEGEGEDTSSEEMKLPPIVLKELSCRILEKENSSGKEDCERCLNKIRCQYKQPPVDDNPSEVIRGEAIALCGCDQTKAPGTYNNNRSGNLRERSDALGCLGVLDPSEIGRNESYEAIVNEVLGR